MEYIIKIAGYVALDNSKVYVPSQKDMTGEEVLGSYTGTCCIQPSACKGGFPVPPRIVGRLPLTYCLGPR